MTLWRKLTTDRLGLVLRGVSYLVRNMERLMSKMDDVKAKVDALVASQAAEHDQITMVIDLIKQLRDDPEDADAAAAVDAALAAFDEAKAKADSDREALKAAADAAAASGDVT